MDIDFDRLRDDPRSPAHLRAAERPGGVVLALEGDGDCAHRIPVRVELSGRDGPAIREAQRLGERHALLERVCPLCRTKRRFQLPLLGPLARSGTPEASPLPVVLGGSAEPYVPLGLSDPLERMEAPPDLAARWYHEAMKHKERGELDQAEAKLRDCIALCDHLRLTGERLNAISVLSSLLSDAGRTGEATQVQALANL